ncbi:MAG: SLBB domain-containing protein [Fidelibacterota bacterium]
MKHVFVLLVLSAGIVWAQSQGKFRPFGEKETEFQEPLVEELTVESLEEFIPLEHPIDPDTYIVGPGDILGVNIITAESLTFTLKVNPTGELLIPSVGIVEVSGLTLSEAVSRIRVFVGSQAYGKSVVDVTLAGVRRFRVLVVGAVEQPGFVTVTPIDRLADVIDKAGGLHKYADEENVEILFNRDGSERNVSLKKFLLTGDVTQNPTFQELDRIEIPFLAGFQEKMDNFITYNESAVFVTGFVKYPGAFRYFPGYSIQDYIGMAGGVLDTGSFKKVNVYRQNSRTDLGFHDYAQPGDTVYVPENARSRLLGDISVFQAVSAALAIYLSYLAATFK